MHVKRLVAMPPVLWVLLITPSLVISHLVAAASESPVVPMRSPKPGCPSKCGDVEIPYPFGIGTDCAWPGLDNFILTCNDSSGTPRPYISSLEIMSISLEAAEMRVFSTVSSICYSGPSRIEPRGSGMDWRFNFTDTDYPFLISPSRNELTAIGCYTQAFLLSYSFLSGCISSCVSLDSVPRDGEECGGLGCCQARIQHGLGPTVWIGWNNGSGADNRVWSFNPCSYAFVGEKGWYKFSRQDLIRDGNNSFSSRAGQRTIPLVLDWAIRKDGTCRPPSNGGGPSAKPTASACVSANSYCVDDPLGNGYLCKCSDGFMGNPYLTGPKGCTNINECELRKSQPEVYEKLYPCGSKSNCIDTNGGYDCVCARFHRGDGKSAQGCRPIVPAYATTIVATLVAIVLLAVLLWFVLTEHKRRLRKGFFDKNGGKLLIGAGINIYTEQQLEKMTNRYSKPIGKGNFGHVFMGNTEDNQRVAVKRAIVEDSKKTQVGGEFFHEILFQFQMRHTNLVRLVGCCLERDVPMLVFEFISNGSLYDVLHGSDGRQHTLPLLKRLDIAIGSAEAVAYMHAHAGQHKRIHGDVKSGNILLDEDLNPKVSDFGSSKVMSATTRYVRFVASDMNYVDPVYMKTNRFTEKSDVYSFGVVLLEIITRKPAKYDGSNSLPIDFVKLYKAEGNGRKMYDGGILTDDEAKSGVYMECLDRVSQLAVRCLKEDDEERPKMLEVVEELKQVKKRVCEGDSCSEAS